MESYARAEPDAENRCQGMTANGQCQLVATPGSKYCIAHGGNPSLEERKKVRNYRLTQWRGRVSEFADSGKVKDIREEIGILRLLLEERLNACQSATDLMIQSHSISDLVVKIEKAVSACHRLESQMGQLLDKQAIIRFAGLVVETISTSINDLLNQGVLTEDAASQINTTVADALLEHATK